jgi:large subunit ribosomal protein L20
MAQQWAYRDRKNRKRTFRRLWIARISAGAKVNGMNYSRLMEGLSAAGIELDRKVLSDLAIHDEAAFAALVAKSKAALEEKAKQAA